MDSSDSSSKAIDKLRARFDQIMSESDAVKRFRELIELLEETGLQKSRVNKGLKESQKSEAFLEVEKRFVTKHETKLDGLAQGFFNCYASPGKAREALDDLCVKYDTNYVLDVVRLGVRRLSKPLGVDLLGIKSEARQMAEVSFEKKLLPDLEKIIPDHGDYMKLKRLNVEKRYEKVLLEIEMWRKASAAVESTLKKFEDKLDVEAKGMSEEDIERLSDSEAAERLRVLPAKMREAIFDAQREDLAAKSRSTF